MEVFTLKTIPTGWKRIWTGGKIVHFSQLVLPASHDAAMYRGGIFGWGRTQCLPMYDQLKYGIRWFDLRPAWTGTKFVIHHGIINGPDLEEVFGGIQKFASENHRELIILKMSDFSFVGPNAYKALLENVHQTFGKNLLKRSDIQKSLGQTTLGEFLSSGTKVVVLIDGTNAPANLPEGIWGYQDWDSTDCLKTDLRVYDRYSDTRSFEKMKHDQMNKFANFGKCDHKNINGDLFLLSWTLTPAFRIWHASQPAITNLEPCLKNFSFQNSYARCLNLVYVDFVEFSHVSEVAIAANERLKFDHQAAH